MHSILSLPCLISCILLSVFMSCYSETVKLEPLSNMSFKTTLTLPSSASKTQIDISKVKLTFPRPHGSVFTTIEQVKGQSGSSNPLELVFSCQSSNTINNCTVLVGEIFSQNTPLDDISLDLVTSEYSIVFSKCIFNMESNNAAIWKSSTTTFNPDSSLSIDILTTASATSSTCKGFTISYDAKSFRCTSSSVSATVTSNSDKKVTINLSSTECPELPEHIKHMKKARAILYSCECTNTASSGPQPAKFTVLELRHPINVGVVLLDIFFASGTIVCIVLLVVGILKFREPNSCKCLSRPRQRGQKQAETSVPATTDTLPTTEPSVLGEIKSDIDLAYMNRHTNTGGSNLLSMHRVPQ